MKDRDRGDEDRDRGERDRGDRERDYERENGTNGDDSKGTNTANDDIMQYANIQQTARRQRQQHRLRTTISIRRSRALLVNRGRGERGAALQTQKLT